MNTTQNYKALRERQKAFFLKYTSFLKKFSLKYMKKISHKIKEDADGESIEMIDLSAVMDSYEKEITSVKNGGQISEIKEPTREYTKKELIDQTIKLVRHDIRKELIQYHNGDPEMEKLVKKEPKSYTVYKRYEAVLSLKEDKIKAMVNFAKDSYRKMAKFLKEG